MILESPMKVGPGTGIFENDSLGRRKLAEVMRDVADTGKGTTEYEGEQITIRRGYEAAKMAIG